MSRALAIRDTRSRAVARSNRGISTTMILLIAGVALVLYLILKNKPAPAQQYLNKEEWDIQWSPDGLPLKVTIHRDARQG